MSSWETFPEVPFKVKCLDPNEGIAEGVEYTVTKVGDPEDEGSALFCLEEVGDQAIYFANRFELVDKETLVVNDQGGVKADSGKPRWSLLDFQTLSDVVDVLELGAKKYSAGNFKHVEPVRYVDAFLRHWYAYQSGEELDLESGKSHLHHMICCLMFLDYFRREGKEIEWHG